MTSMMEQIEIDRKQAEFDRKFVKFGYVLFEALEQIAMAKGAEEDAYVYANIAKNALDKFRYEVGISGGAISTEKACCDQCVHFFVSGFSKRCANPDNIGTWESAIEFKNIPSKINKNNDCEWYLEKEGSQDQ